MAMTNETKVGLLVVVALAGLAWLSIRSGSFGLGDLGSPKRELTTVFSDVGGIQEGSQVMVAGVAVGEVSGIQLQGNGTAKVSLKVKKNVPLPADVHAEIATNGIIGERFISLASGGTSTALLPADAVSIPSGATADAGAIGTNFAKISSDLEAMTGTLRQVLGDPENAKKLQTIIDGLATFGGSMQTDGSDIIANLKVASESLSNILGNNEMQAGNAINNISTVAANLAVITDRLKNGEGPLGQLLMADGASGTSPMGDLQVALKDLRETMAKINGGEGTIGKLVNDPATAEKLNNALDTFSDVSNRIEQMRTEIAFEGSSLMSEDNISKGGVNILLQPRPTRFYVAGITADGYGSKARDENNPTNPYYGKDFGKEMKFTLQYGQVYQNVADSGQDVALRLGLKDSTGGLGVDTWSTVPYVNKDVKLSADLYDFGGTNMADADNPQLDLRARVDLLGNSLYGIAGYDNVLNEKYSSPVVGIGMRFQDDDLKYLAGQAL